MQETGYEMSRFGRILICITSFILRQINIITITNFVYSTNDTRKGTFITNLGTIGMTVNFASIMRLVYNRIGPIWSPAVSNHLVESRDNIAIRPIVCYLLPKTNAVFTEKSQIKTRKLVTLHYNYTHLSNLRFQPIAKHIETRGFLR